MLRWSAAHRSGVAWLAALAVLWAQALGLAHAVAHPHASGAAAFAHEAAQQDAHDHGSASGFFDAHHDQGTSQCQLFDQLTHADELAGPATAWTFAAPQGMVLTAVPAPLRATCARGYHARGPPPLLA